MSSPREPPRPPAATPYWQARTGTGLHPDLLAYSQSVGEDQPFLVHDLAGSSAHVLGLHRAGLLGRADATALLLGLRRVHALAASGELRLDPALEDIHMNVEAALTTELGDVGRRLHTGRSRNDQVATCIVLFARHELAHLAAACNALGAALAAQAQSHLRTPWVARTHGQPAQPATLGFLLAAHALRAHDAARATLAAFDTVGESPLGCGAVAGTTLPLDPAHTAGLLGLRPPRNALLATGTRDAALAATGAAEHAGLVAAGLAQDLLDLIASGALRLPEGYTTGSSLMPQKRNPDALELARAKGKAVAGHRAAITAIVAGLGLGYQRDFQATKPHLAAALRDARGTIELLAGLVPGLTFDAKALGAAMAQPGIVATDVAEALVAGGMPFRTAYATVASAYAQVEKGTPFADALATQGLPPAALESALAALQPDPSRRASRGGPAPKAVQESLDALAALAKDTQAAVASAQAAAERPLALLDHDPDDLLET